MKGVIMRVETFNSEEYCGYKQITTFYQDFSIADNYGISAIKDTFQRAFKEWKGNVKYFTELVLVLNWKCWRWVEDKYDYCELYSNLYYKARDYALDNFKGEDLTYFYTTTD